MPPMKAIAIDRYGDNSQVKLRELPDPVPGAGDLLVEVHAASINPVDFKIRDGKLKAIVPLKFPLVLGSDLSGVVRAVGAQVTGFKPGDEVFARVEKDRLGTYAELAALSASTAALKPKNLTHVEAASLPLVGLTAWQALVELIHLQAGQKVLIHAGAGGVGSFAIQLAKHLGATVATTASARNQVLCSQLGADVVIDYNKQRFEDAVHDCDAVLDTLGGDTLLRSFGVVKPGGTVVSIAALPDAATAEKWGMNPAIRLALRFLTRKITAAARARGVTYRYLFMDPSGEQLAQIAALVEQGAIKPQVEKTFPLAETAAALAAVETGRTRGKVVVQIR